MKFISHQCRTFAKSGIWEKEKPSDKLNVLKRKLSQGFSK